MKTQDIAEKLCAHCKAGTERQALDELYADDAVSVEAMTPEGVDPVTKGRDAIKGKHDWWDSAMEVHSIEQEGPFVHGDAFTVIFDVDVTDKSSGQRWKSKEVALYEVQGGKIVKESFFMAPMS